MACHVLQDRACTCVPAPAFLSASSVKVSREGKHASANTQAAKYCLILRNFDYHRVLRRVKLQTMLMMTLVAVLVHGDTANCVVYVQVSLQGV